MSQHLFISLLTLSSPFAFPHKKKREFAIGSATVEPPATSFPFNCAANISLIVHHPSTISVMCNLSQADVLNAKFNKSSKTGKYLELYVLNIYSKIKAKFAAASLRKKVADACNKFKHKIFCVYVCNL